MAGRALMSMVGRLSVFCTRIGRYGESPVSWDEPNPIMFPFQLPDTWVSRHRNLDCTEYEWCLDIAVREDWPSWTCRFCKRHKLEEHNGTKD